MAAGGEAAISTVMWLATGKRCRARCPAVAGDLGPQLNSSRSIAIEEPHAGTELANGSGRMIGWRWAEYIGAERTHGYRAIGCALNFQAFVCRNLPSRPPIRNGVLTFANSLSERSYPTKQLYSCV